MKKLSFNIFGLLTLVAVSISSLSSCSDDMSGDSYYTFTGQMMSQYLQENENYSEFADIVTRAGMMDMLSAYGKYTLFAPNNAAIDTYLAKKGRTLESLSAEECDTLARIHLISEMYSVAEMPDGTLAQNMLGRNITISHGTDTELNSVVVVNSKSQVYFKQQDDSVENGIVQPVSSVLENSNQGVIGLLQENPNVSLYTEAFEKTGLYMKMSALEDKSWEKNYKTLSKRYDDDYVTGGRSSEACEVPKKKLYGFTAFVVPDSILKLKGINNLDDLYKRACAIYDPIYPEDVAKPGHDFSNLQDTINPLYRFMAYHVLNRNVQGYNLLTVKGDAGIDKDEVNPTEWYTTLLPYTMLKVEHLTAPSLVGTNSAQKGDYFLNRRYDGKKFFVSGTHVTDNSNDPDYVNNGPNGYYFLVDDILKFDTQTRDTVDNCRIRMDFSTIFPEIQTNNMRMNGKSIGASNTGVNYYLPDGYLDGVTMSGNTRFIYWYPKSGYYSMNGDEFDIQSEFDFTFTLPPVPTSGTYQIRLGYAPMNTTEDNAQYRGQAQIYFDGVAQGLPLDFSKTLNEVTGVDATYYNTTNRYSTQVRDDDSKRQEDFKALKNAGYYRGPYSVFNSSDGTISGKYNAFADMKNTARKVLCTVYIEAGKTHTLTFKNVSTVLPKVKEAMLDYLELVPKSVYGISEGDDAEDDL